MKTKFVHRIGFLRTRTQRSGTQCNGTRTRWLFELLLDGSFLSARALVVANDLSAVMRIARI